MWIRIMAFLTTRPRYQHLWFTPSFYSISHQLFFPCSRNDPPFLRNAAATSHLRYFFPTPRRHSWRPGKGGARIHIKCTKCLTATSLSFLAGLWATSYSAETYEILHGLEWCISHSTSCAFESITLFSDSLSALPTLSANLPYLIPKSLFYTQSLLYTLSDSP